MEANLKYWPRLKDHFDSNYGKYVLNDLVNLAKMEFQIHSPLPTELLKIPMVGPCIPCQFMENIVKNICDQHVLLRYLTWLTIRNIYEEVEKGNNLSPDPEQLLGQKALEIVLIISKLSAFELYRQDVMNARRKLKLPEVKIVRTNEIVYPASKLFDETMQPALSNLRDAVCTDTNNRIMVVNENVCMKIKEFLHLPPVMAAFCYVLELVEMTFDDEKIRHIIDGMRIYSMNELPQFRGFALRDGILLVRDESNFIELLSGSGNAKTKATLLTMACHETVHFLARSLDGDFNFSSPGKDKSMPRRLESSLYDVKGTIEETNLELGRYIELLLFDGIQPAWDKSDMSAAKRFLENATKLQHYPLVQPDPANDAYLVPRISPSLSLCDMTEWELDMLLA